VKPGGNTISAAAGRAISASPSAMTSRAARLIER
jgi:hypothetical protein